MKRRRRHFGATRRLLRLAVFTAVIAGPTLAYAGFMWLDNDWDVALDMNVDKGTGSKRRAFGLTATKDGQILDTGADVAVARAEALASTDVTGAGLSSFLAQVDFDRSFQLSDSPGGWKVTLQEVLSGSLAALDPQMASFASVIANASIRGTDVNNMPVDGPSLKFDEMNTEDDSVFTDIIFEVLTETETLPDGKYTVTGLLRSKALIFLNPLTGSAQSKFFDGGLAVSLVASPIPEPPTWLCVLTGGLLLLTMGVRNARAHNRSSSRQASGSDDLAINHPPRDAPRRENAASLIGAIRMKCRQTMLTGGVIAACIGAVYSQALGGMVTAEVGFSPDPVKLGIDGTTSLSAYSQQGNKTNGTFHTTLITGGVDKSATAPKPTESDLLIKVERKGGTVQKYSPIVKLNKQAKSLVTEKGDAEEVVSQTGAHTGAGAQLVREGDGARLIGAVAFADESNGKPPNGKAAAGAYDPFTLSGGASYVYGATINATLQLSDFSAFGGVEIYALDSSVFSDDLNNFVEDGSPFENTLWALSLTADGPLAGTSGVQIDFKLNPLALSEIQLPSSYLFGLPGYSSGLTNAEIAGLINDAVVNAISQALTFDGSTASLANFGLFPSGTLFRAAGDVVYAEGVSVGLTDVPQPGTLWLIGAGLLGLAGVTLKRGGRSAVTR